ncbi:MAG: hypothetical protein AB7F35_00890 [Acetobacteraceae bacterium]
MRAILIVALVTFPIVVVAQSAPLCRTPKECQDQVRQSSTVLDRPAYWADHPAARDGIARTCAEKKPGWEVYARACAAINRKK